LYNPQEIELGSHGDAQELSPKSKEMHWNQAGRGFGAAAGTRLFRPASQLGRQTL